jgi:DNA-binding GntR family transcriptional regulator
VPAGPIERQSLHAEVAERVRTRIVGRELEPASRIAETALCATHRISRRPLREALKVLASEGWVSLAPGMGAFVTALGPQDIDELFPVMALLEGRCACDAVRRMTATDARRLATLHERLERLAEAGDLDGYYAVNADFHRAIESLAGNPWLIRVTSELRGFHGLHDELRSIVDVNPRHPLVAASEPPAEPEAENTLQQRKRSAIRSEHHARAKQHHSHPELLRCFRGLFPLHAELRQKTRA